MYAGRTYFYFITEQANQMGFDARAT